MFLSHRIAILSLGALTLTSCATGSKTPTEAPIATTGKAVPVATEHKVAAPVASTDMTVLGVKLKNTSFDYPVVVNPMVEEWVEYFTGRGRVHFERYLERSEHFIPYILPILKEKGLPSDLVYLAMIESGFHNHAKSHARAVGTWQFISATGKRYGMKINWWVDERRDIQKSTVSAGMYLKTLYDLFDSWELAAAAYNSGEAKIDRAIRKYGTNDFWKLVRHKYLRPETKNYVPKIMAAAIVAKNRVQFGFPEKYDSAPSLEDEAPAVDDEANLATVVLDKDKNAEDTTEEDEFQAEDLADLLEDDEFELDGEDELPAKAQVAAAPTLVLPSMPHVSKKGILGSETILEFEIPSPADLQSIANAAGLSYQVVKNLNPELLRWCTPPSEKTYKIKLPSSVKDKFLATYNQPGFHRVVTFATHKIKRGESLGGIAAKYKIKVDPLKELNAGRSFGTGTELVLPMPTDHRSYAALDLYDPPERRRRGRRSRRSTVRRSIKKSYSVGAKQRKAARLRTGRVTEASI